MRKATTNILFLFLGIVISIFAQQLGLFSFGAHLNPPLVISNADNSKSGHQSELIHEKNVSNLIDLEIPIRESEDTQRIDGNWEGHDELGQEIHLNINNGKISCLSTGGRFGAIFQGREFTVGQGYAVELPEGRQIMLSWDGANPLKVINKISILWEDHLPGVLVSYDCVLNRSNE